MLSKQKDKYIQSLKIKKFRQKYGNFIVEGEKMAHELLLARHFKIELICAVESWILENEAALKRFADQIVPVTEAELKNISSLTTPNKVLIVAQKPTPQYDDAWVNAHFSLYLDGIQDPGNMGTILRIADWFSMPYVFCSETCVDVWSPKVVQASMGAFLRVHAHEVPFDALRARFPEVPVLATVLRGDNIFAKNFDKKGFIVIGNEGNGISDAILKNADFRISIPGGGGAESLNAAVATGIITSVLLNLNA